MKYLLASAAFCLSVTAASAGADYGPAMRDYLATKVAAWAADPVLVDAIKAQNAANALLTQTDIDALDTKWRAEVGQGEQPTIAPVLANPAADFLRARMAESGGAITEAFIMDNRGLNVAASAATSDFWQGDEPKWQQTFAAGDGAVNLGEVEFDESSQIYEGQVSVTISDPATREAIGAITLGLNPEALF